MTQRVETGPLFLSAELRDDKDDREDRNYKDDKDDKAH